MRKTRGDKKGRGKTPARLNDCAKFSRLLPIPDRMAIRRTRTNDLATGIRVAGAFRQRMLRFARMIRPRRLVVVHRARRVHRTARRVRTLFAIGQRIIEIRPLAHFVRADAFSAIPLLPVPPLVPTPANSLADEAGPFRGGGHSSAFDECGLGWCCLDGSGCRRLTEPGFFPSHS